MAATAFQDVITAKASSNGRAKPETVERHLPAQLPARLRVRDGLRRVWGRMVVKQSDGTWKINKTSGGIVISAILSLAIIAIVGLLWQRDEIIRLRTIAELQQQTNQQLKSDVDQAKNWAQSAKGDFRELQGRFEQFALERTKERNGNRRE